MIKYTVKRLVVSFIVFLAVMFVVYTIMYMLPESYVDNAARELCHLSNNSTSEEEWQRRIERECGIDENLVAGYLKWLGSTLKGEFGISWCYGVPVEKKFFSVIDNSLLICLTALVFEIIIAIPVGIICGVKRNSAFDRIMSVVCVVLMSVPAFFIAIFLKYIFVIESGVFELGGLKSNLHIYMNSFEKLVDRLNHMVLPTATLIIAGSGALVRYTRTNVSKIMDSRYVKAARARGLCRSRVLVCHTLRNSAVPIINIICGALPAVITGSMLIEAIFSIDGIGYVAFIAMEKGDIPFTMFYMTNVAIITILSAFIADMLCAALDYRVRYGFYGGTKR